MFSIKASLTPLVLAVLFVCSSQAQINITIAEAEAANSSAKQWLQRQNVGRAGGVELLQPVTAKISSHYAGSGHTFPAEKCIDGDTEGPSKDGNLCHTHYGYPKSERAPWLAIDYGSAVTINKVEIFNREDGGGDRAKNVDVRVSNELPTSASQMFSGGSLLGRFAGPGTDGQHIIITGEAISGRYVIVQMDNGVGVPLNLKEVKAFGAKGELLQPVTASMSSRFESLYEPAKCIDGDTITPSIQTNTGGGNMCHSRNERSPWLAIDYGARVNVQRVEIFNREDCCGDWARNVDVRVSNELPTSASEMFSGGSLLGHFAGPATNGQHIIITGETITGRYVIVQMDNSEDHPLNLREVKAFGVKGSPCVNDKCVGRCEEGWEEHGDHCYLWSTEKMTWIAAENFCQEQGGHLASVASHEKMGYVRSGLAKIGVTDIWLGGNDMEKERVWIWTDCTPWGLTFWGPGEPSNWGKIEHCLNHNGNPWNDAPCDSYKAPALLCSKKICKGELSTTTIPPPSINNNGVELKPVSATLSSVLGVEWGGELPPTALMAT